MITPHDLFMAHAPYPAPDWFLPVMLKDCPIVPSINSLPTGPLRDEIKSVWDSDVDPWTPEGKAWMENRDALAGAQAEWQAEFRIQCEVQWPRKWADLMMEQRP